MRHDDKAQAKQKFSLWFAGFSWTVRACHGLYIQAQLLLQLTSVDLSGNRLSGTLPNSWAKLSQARHAAKLDLMSTCHEDHLLTSYWMLATVQLLYVMPSECRLTICQSTCLNRYLYRMCWSWSMSLFCSPARPCTTMDLHWPVSVASCKCKWGSFFLIMLGCNAWTVSVTLSI